MKKFLFAALAAAVFCVSSCTPSDIEQNRQESAGDLVEMTFGASTATESTRTILGEETDGRKFPILWNPEDSINVFDVNATPYQSAKLRNQIDSAMASTTFRGLVNPSETGYYALYPWQKIDNTGLDEEEWLGLIKYNEETEPATLRLEWCGYNQQATAFGYDPEKAFMMAYSDASNDKFEFKQVFSYVKFNVTFDCDYVVLASNGDEKLGCQDVWLKMVDDCPSIVKTTLRQGVKSVTLRTKSFTADSTKTYLPAGTYLMAVIPGTLSKGFTITFKPTSIDNTVEKETSKSVTLTHGNILNLGSFSTSDFAGFPSTGEWEGSGAADDPYLITTLEQWNLLAERMNGKSDTYKKYYDKHYKLNNNIDCGGAVIGCVGDTGSHPFEGTFDGDGHTISNYYPGTGKAVEALFGYISSATIKNLTVSPKGFKERYDGFSAFAYSPLIGVCFVDSGKDNAANKIINCHAVALAGEPLLQMCCHKMDCFYGSIIAWIRDKVYIMKCSNSINVFMTSTDVTEDTFTAGGIAGAIYRYYPTIETCVFDRCRNTGSIHAKSAGESIAGGILGYDYDHINNDVVLRISNCENRGKIDADAMGEFNSHAQYAGGIVGDHDSDGRWQMTDGDPFVYNCLNTGAIYACGETAFIGGILGYCHDDDTKLYNCVNLGTIDGNSAGGGNYGFHSGNDEGIFTNCYTYAWGWLVNYHVDDEFTADDLNSNRQNIPAHPDKAVVFAEYDDNKLHQYCSWSGTKENTTLRLSF